MRKKRCVFKLPTLILSYLNEVIPKIKYTSAQSHGKCAKIGEIEMVLDLYIYDT